MLCLKMLIKMKEKNVSKIVSGETLNEICDCVMLSKL